MSNFINPQVLAAESLDQLEYELVAGNLMYRDRTNEYSNVRGKKVGDKVDIRIVSDFVVDEFTSAINTQEINQAKNELEIEKHFDVSITVGARERALNLDGIRQEVINPAMQAMAQEIDTYLLSKAIQSQGLYASTTLCEDAADIAQANKIATRQQISKMNRIGIIDDDLEATLLGTDTFSKFDTRGQDGVTALREASLGKLLGVDWYSSVNFADVTHTMGDGTTTLDNSLSTSNVQGNSSLIVDPTTGTFNAGDKIVIAGAKRAYTVETTTAATATEIPLAEEISENMSQLDGAAVTVISSGNDVSYQGIFMNPGAFGYAMPPLDPAAGDKAGTAIANGMSIRFTEGYDINGKGTIWSFDCLIGAAATDPRKSMLLGSYS